MRTALVKPDGTVCVADQPAPQLLPGSARIRLTRSLISTGTETELIRRRRESPEGEDLRPGYSAAGRIVELSQDCQKGRAGQLVGCAGWALATHSQEAVVPRNLFVPVPEGVHEDNVAFIGCAVTCMHALRQAGISAGESVAVFGMGLFGQMVARIAAAFGARAFGVAKHPHQAECARGVCRAVWGPEELDAAASAPAGEELMDAAIIAAGGEQTRMIVQAGKVLRDRGTVVVLGRGWASIDFREEMFKKELKLRNTRAYGPGRYDPVYERQGVDYPLGYVRWTENRNMAGVLDLMARRLLDLRPLITSRCRLEDIPAAYERLMARPNREIAVLVEYD